jgi:hypothetical protein
MAERGGDEGRRKLPGYGAPAGSVAARKYGAGDKNRRWWRAERRRAFANERAHLMKGSADRRAIPSHVNRGEMKDDDGRTRRPGKEYGR